jgi:2-oxoglutarate ferredoxin oxidoreductase subunit delta
MAKGRIEVNDLYCKGCGLCLTVCPKQVIAIDDEHLTPKGYHPAMLADPEGACTGCAICAVICPDAAITVYRLTPAPERAGVAA